MAVFCYHLAYLKVYTKFENTRSNWSWEICDRIFIGEKEKNEQIKGLISNMKLFFVTQYNSSLSSFVPNFRILTGVVAENYLTEKKFTNRQNNIVTEKAKTIHSLYTSYRGYKYYRDEIHFWGFHQCFNSANHTNGITGFTQGSLSKIQGLLKAIFQFSRTKSIGKILIQVLKFFFKNTRLR